MMNTAETLFASSLNRSHSFRPGRRHGGLWLLALGSSVLFSTHLAMANDPRTYNAGNTTSPLDITDPTNFSVTTAFTAATDLSFSTTATTIFQLGTGANATSLTVESLNFQNSGTFTIGNNSSSAAGSNATLTLGNSSGQDDTASNATSTDLIYVRGTTGNLTIQGANLQNGQTSGTGTLGVTFAASGTLHVVGQLTISAPITSAAGVTLTKTSAGTLTLSGNNSNFLGGVALNSSGGTLQIGSSTALSSSNALSLSSSTKYAVAGAFSEGAGATVTGATYNSSTRLASGGTVVSGTNTQGVGMLTLAGSATLDFGASKNTQVFGSFTPNAHNLNIIDYSSSANITGGTSGTDGTDDRLIFFLGSTNTTGLGTSALNDITFNGVASSAGQISLGGGFFEIEQIAAVPEPSSFIAGILTCGLLGLRLRRQIRALLLRRAISDQRLG